MHKIFTVFIGVVFVCFALLQALAIRPPNAFPAKTFLTVEKGTPLKTVAANFEKAGLVRSAFWLRLFVTLRRGSGGAVAGDYFFKNPASLLRIAERLARGEYGLEPVRVVVPEGLSNREIAALLVRTLAKFSSQEFLALAAAHEGYLFPDTYQFLPNVAAAQVLAAMEADFNKKTALLAPLVAAFGKPLHDVVIIASFLEKEARTLDTRERIADILWKRLRLGMPLQVDSVFPYIFAGKKYDLTDGDLLVDSPYNTYRYKGLPPGPIANPGLDALRASVTPIETPYLYYLSDKEGIMHYAKTHDEHLVNRAKYLNL